MAFIPPTLEQIRKTILRDIRALEPSADVSVDSDYYVRASALASCVSGLYAHQSWMVRQAFPDTADADYLDMHAALRHIYRKNATYAAGYARVIGNIGVVIAQGTQILSEGHYYEVSEESILDSPQAVIKVRSLATGANQNRFNEKEATFMSAPQGVQSAVVLFDVVGGTDAESDTELLNRLLEEIRRPPAGGTRNDYRRWAMSVEGVTSAYVYPQRRGEGTVDIAITSDNGIPSDEIVKACQDYVDSVRPVTAKVNIVKPVLKTVDFEIEVKVDDSTTLPDIQTEIKTALADFFLTLKPADTLVLSQIEAVISDLIGVVDRRILSPRGNLNIDAYREMGWFKLGKIVVRAMP